MKVLSVNIGQSKTVEWRGQPLTTSIFKAAVEGEVEVHELGIEGDTQSDLRVHGGINKAVYAYSSEHYEFWKQQLPEFDFPWGTFGENLSTEGLLESEVSLGDLFRIGTVELKVIQPRFPCNKFGMRFGDPAMIKRFLEENRSGIYFAVEKEGKFSAGDEIEVLMKTGGLTIKDFFEVYASKAPSQAKINQALSDPNLIEEWHEYFENRLIEA